MSNGADFRKLAQQCRDNASLRPDDPNNAIWLNLAAEYDALADAAMQASSTAPRGQRQPIQQQQKKLGRA
jgi:hypothetical protein